MKFLIVLSFLAASFSSFAAVGFEVKCEMTAVKNKKNSISAIAKVVDGYGMGETTTAIDDLYGFMLEVQDSSLSVIIYDENDEVGSLSCDVDGKGKKGQLICKDAVYNDNDKHVYDLICRYN